MTGDYELHQGDCLDVMRDTEPGSVDMVLADPPYCSGGASSTDRKRSTSRKYQSGGVSTLFPEYDGDSRDQRGALLWYIAWLGSCLRLARRGASCLVFCDWRQVANTTDALQAAGWVHRGLLVWDKVNGRPQPNSYTSQAEFVVWGTRGAIDRRPTTDARYVKGLVSCLPPARGERVHMNQKPVPVLAHLIGLCPDGGTVLDPFMGSGSTGVACAETGRRFVGIELSEHYCEVAERRVSEAYAQGRLDLGEA